MIVIVFGADGHAENVQDTVQMSAIDTLHKAEGCRARGFKMTED